MRITPVVTLLFLLGAGIILLGAGPVQYSEENVSGISQGNHELDCTVIRPWRSTSDPADYKYPVIGWANGWDQGNVIGEHTTEGYKPGLIEWTLDGPYIVVAANQWSAQESDVLACVQWIKDENETVGSEYEDKINVDRIGLAGHSQGGGAVIKAGDGWTSDPDEITAVIAMNPYGPAWVNPGSQDGPVMLLAGSADTTTPTSSFIEVFEAILDEGDEGGLLAELEGGTHNSEAWGVDDETGATLDYEGAREKNFGEYQDVSELWWQFHLNGKDQSGRQLKRLLDRAPWDWDYAFTANFDLY